MCMWATGAEEGEKRKKRVKRQPLQKYNFEASWRSRLGAEMLGRFSDGRLLMKNA